MTTATTIGTFNALLALGLLGAPCLQAPALAADVTVQLRVFPHAVVDAPTLQLARETATDLLESAGVGVHWRDCPMGDPACGSEAAARSITVRLLPTRLSGGHVCGQAIGDLVSGATVLVYVPRTTELARTVRLSAAGRSNPALATLEAGHLLGLTIAHEVGHALGLIHATSGVMKARLVIEDVLALRASRLMFMPREGARMRQAMLGGPRAVVADAR
jgi:hypothetical protein